MKTKLPPCFDCGKRLQGKHRILLFNTMDGHQRTFHKQCAEQLLKDSPELWEKELSPETWVKYLDNFVFRKGEPVVLFGSKELYEKFKNSDLKLSI